MIRVTLEKDGWVGWNGHRSGPEVTVKEFENEYEACDWFIHDSYFEQGYTRRAVWERLD